MALTSSTAVVDDWEMDLARLIYRNKRTGQVMPMTNTMTMPSWGSPQDNSLVDAVVKHAAKVEEYTAMRTFLQHAYPEALAQFDAAFAAAKRIGVKNADANKTPSP